MTDYDSDYWTDSDYEPYYGSDSDYDSDNIIEDILEIYYSIIESEYSNVNSMINDINTILDKGNVNINTRYYFVDINGFKHYNFLETATYWGLPEILELLVDRGIDINIASPQGLTSLNISNNEAEFKPDGTRRHKFTDYGRQIWTEKRNILLQNGAKTWDELVYIRRLQRRIRTNIKIRRAKRNLAYSKSYLDKRLNRKPERLSELAPDLLENISKYM